MPLQIHAGKISLSHFMSFLTGVEKMHKIISQQLCDSMTNQPHLRSALLQQLTCKCDTISYDKRTSIEEMVTGYAHITETAVEASGHFLATYYGGHEPNIVDVFTPPAVYRLRLPTGSGIPNIWDELHRFFARINRVQSEAEKRLVPFAGEDEGEARLHLYSG